MNVKEQVGSYLKSLDEPKRSELEELHRQILELLPGRKLWFLDGKDKTGKVVTNPNIGYGEFSMLYKDGSTRDFYQIGISANSAGISVYIMGIADKKYLKETFGDIIGKASVTGYCIKFRSLKDIDRKVLFRAILYGAGKTDLE